MALKIATILQNIHQFFWGVLEEAFRVVTPIQCYQNYGVTTGWTVIAYNSFKSPLETPRNYINWNARQELHISFSFRQTQ